MGSPDRLTIDVEAFFPDLGRNLVVQSALSHNVPELGLEYFAHGLDRQKEIHTGGVPFAVGSGQGAAGDHIMNMRMVLKLSSPGMEHPEEPGEITADVFGIFCQHLDGG